MADQVNRRQFLGQAAVAGAALSAASVLQTSASLHADAANNTIVVGVMGLSRGATLAAQFADVPGVVVKYVCDVDSKRAGTVAEKLGKANHKTEAIGDFRKILDDKEVDALVCAAPDHWHAPATILGCKAGKHVYVEKPCCHNPAEGELMIEVARKYKRAVQMGNQRRSDPSYIDIIQQLREGLIGRVYCARGYYANQRPTIGKGKPAPVPENLNYELWQGPAPRMPYVDNRIPYNWHWFWHWGTGELGNNGVHALDICRWGTGVDFPSRVTSLGGRYRYQDDQETPDTQDVAYEFPGGVQISYHGLSCNSHAHDFIEFYGENGALGFGMHDSYTLYDARNKVIKSSSEKLNHIAHLENFRDAILSDKSKSLNSEIAEGYKSTMLCLLGNIAQRSGRVLNIDSTNGHIQNDPEAMKLWKREYEKGWEPTL